MTFYLIQNFQFYGFKKTLFSAYFELNLFLLEHLFEGICNWPQVGRVVLENPDLPVQFVLESLHSLKEANEGLTEPYEFD